MRRVGVTLSIAFVLAQPALGVPSAQRIERAVKIVRNRHLRLHYANLISVNDVSFHALPGGVRVGTDFDLIDQAGYLGRVRVFRVEAVDSGCPGFAYQLAVARFTFPPMRDAQVGVMVAVGSEATGADRRPMRAARLFLGAEVRPQPRVSVDLVPDVGLDIDGDLEADVVRYGYECPSLGVSDQGWCIDTWIRDSSGWHVVERLSFRDCG